MIRINAVCGERPEEIVKYLWNSRDFYFIVSLN